LSPGGLGWDMTMTPRFPIQESIMKRLSHWLTCLAGSALLLGSVAIVRAEAPAGKDDMLAGPDAKAPQDGKGNRERRGFDGQRQREGGPLHGLLRDLKLTDEQKTQIREIAEDHRQEAEQYRKEHQDEIKKLQEEIKALHEKIKAIHEKGPKPQAVIDDVRAVLTPEQQKEFDARLEKMKERRDERREGGDRRGPAPGAPGGDAMMGPPHEGPGGPGGPDRAMRLLNDDERAKLKDMTPEERHDWLQDHREELKERAQKLRKERGPKHDGQDAPPPPPPAGGDQLDI
jgi:Spy/CpxP family protein refolding chaperone